jgi:hypothetical protein
MGDCPYYLCPYYLYYLYYLRVTVPIILLSLIISIICAIWATRVLAQMCQIPQYDKTWVWEGNSDVYGMSHSPTSGWRLGGNLYSLTDMDPFG